MRLSCTLEELLEEKTESVQDNKLCDQPGRKIVYGMEIIDAQNVKLGAASVDYRKRSCVLTLQAPLWQFHRHFPAGLTPVFGIKPCWQSDRKTICQSAVLKGCLLSRD